MQLGIGPDVKLTVPLRLLAEAGLDPLRMSSHTVTGRRASCYFGHPKQLDSCWTPAHSDLDERDQWAFALYMLRRAASGRDRRRISDWPATVC